jgi:2-dehydro-3-deoxyphosphogluconate aldolase / (4S)-4-hydroxy-2-oxoglutarate aldolase
MTVKDVEVLRAIKEYGICAIVRGTRADDLCRIADALLAGGVKAIEVTFNTPGAAEMIQTLSDKYSGDMLVGAGTCLDPETAQTAIASGARFVLSPNFNPDTVRLCSRRGVLPVPGAATPTEVAAAYACGARLIKIFPAGALGARYIKEIRGPLEHIDMMAVGGVGLDNIVDFFKAGACSAGIGSELVDRRLVEAGDFARITARAKAFVEAAGARNKT